MKKKLKYIVYILIIIYILPTLGATVWWSLKKRPSDYKTANWAASGFLPQPQKNAAAIYILAARTGGMKGAVSVHSWFVIKKPGNEFYDRYDVVGWGKPVRHNAYPPDAYWYSNYPYIVHQIHGEKAAQLIQKIEKSIQNYPYGKQGDYTIYPGPNSNSFVAKILRDVPEMGSVLSSNAIGRDYLGQNNYALWDGINKDLHISFKGYVGFSLGLQSGVEINLGGLVAGIGLKPFSIKIPAIGNIDIL